MSGLSGDQITFYREQGYLTVPDALDLGTVERLSAIVGQWTIEASGVSESDGFFDLEDSHQASDPRVRRFKRPVRNHPEFNALARSDAVLDLISPLIGDAIRISPTDDDRCIRSRQPMLRQTGFQRFGS